MPVNSLKKKTNKTFFKRNKKAGKRKTKKQLLKKKKQGGKKSKSNQKRGGEDLFMGRSPAFPKYHEKQKYTEPIRASLAVKNRKYYIKCEKKTEKNGLYTLTKISTNSNYTFTNNTNPEIQIKMTSTNNDVKDGDKYEIRGNPDDIDPLEKDDPFNYGYGKGGKRVKKTLKKRNKMFGGTSCIGPYEACNFYHHLKYTHNYNQDMLAGDPKTVNPDPTVQHLGNH